MKEQILETAVLGGGCFWCLDATYSHCMGVSEVVSGYSGGTTSDPTYEQVCSGETGHAEVVKITFDSSTITYDDILHIFFSIHDPTTLNRQGNDVGTQYRSVVFTTSPEQLETAKKIIKELEDEKLFDKSIVTQVLPLEKFYRAEENHQKYYDKNPEQAYCYIVIAPKISKFRQKYSKFYLEN
jgi:peptide-methionine (S)-S-oxide reductase